MAFSQAKYLYAHNRGLETFAENSDAKETAEVELESQVGISGEIIEESEYEDHKDQDEDGHCEDEIDQLLDGMSPAETID